MRYKGFNYTRYMKWYRQQELKQAKKGYVMYSPLYSREQAQLQYDMIKSELSEQVTKGKRSAVGNVYQYMARNQVAELSYAQAKAYNRLAKSTGMKITLDEIRHKSLDFIKNEINWDMVKQDRKQAKGYYNEHHNISFDGYTFSSVESYVAYKYFGSDPR